MLKSVDNYQVEILITLALVTGGYALANRMHLSGPLAMVVAGLLIGNRGRQFAMSEQTRQRLDAFWELVDEFLNAVLFVLIGRITSYNICYTKLLRVLPGEGSGLELAAVGLLIFRLDEAPQLEPVGGASGFGAL